MERFFVSTFLKYFRFKNVSEVNDGYFVTASKTGPSFKCISHSFELRVWAKVLMEVPVMKITNHFKTGWKNGSFMPTMRMMTKHFFWNTKKQFSSKAICLKLLLSYENINVGCGQSEQIELKDIRTSIIISWSFIY